MDKKYYKQVPVTISGEYTTSVPFNIGIFVTEKNKLTTNDTLVPLNGADLEERFRPVPGYGSIYRLVGDGVHAPVFDSAFKKASSSGNYDSTDNTLNLITFIFDGVDFWYTIVQPL
jgi:hypothetical protein